VFSYTTVLPATVQGIQRYPRSGLIKGIGPVMAEHMVKHFGVDIASDVWGIGFENGRHDRHLGRLRPRQPGARHTALDYRLRPSGIRM
jgi:hypothetical protein